MRFCSIEMGSFYLDIIKDRQYTAKADSVARQLPDRAVPYRGSAGALDGADHVLHRGRNLGLPAGRARNTSSPASGMKVCSAWPTTKR
jgi:hypothetical protein